MKKIVLTFALLGGFSVVSRAAELLTGSNSKVVAKIVTNSSTRRITDVTICRDCGNGNQACGQGANATEARAALNTAVKAGC